VFNFDSNAAALYIGATGNEGDLQIRDSAGRTVFNFDANTGNLYLGATGNDSDLQIRDASGRTVLNFDSSHAALYLGANGNEGDLQIRDGSGRTVFNFDSNAAALYIGASGNEGDLQIRDGAGRTVFNFNSQNAALYVGASGNEGDVIVRDNGGNDTIHLDGNSGDIILRNADAAEQFEVTDAGAIKPGMIMTIDENGKLKPSNTQYDRKAVGVVAGAGNYRPGIIFDKKNDNINQAPISVLGKASCMADATYAPIEVGDMLTTSQTTGHAMKATDINKSFGSIIGKALTPLSSGVGFVDILVTLQ
jgi:hypothetical protein